MILAKQNHPPTVGGSVGGGKYFVNGGNILSGDIAVQGSKNCLTPILAASIMVSGETVLTNTPDIGDLFSELLILNSIGVSYKKMSGVIFSDAKNAESVPLTSELCDKMRSSILFLAPLLARTGKCDIAKPGGCKIGDRPIDFHLDVIRKMGATVKDEYDLIKCRADKRLHGAIIQFPKISVGATETAICAAVTASGTTKILGAACEPEIMGLAKFLNKCGAKIRGAGTNYIVIEGVKELNPTNFEIIPDRIATVTYLAAAAATRGEIYIRNADSNALYAILPFFEAAGCHLSVSEKGRTIYLNAKNRALKSIGQVTTSPYPGFATDAQPLLMALTASVNGTSIFEDGIFENRFMLVPELAKMGAKIY
ncbi:MAG: UDP-N-acetylglucosamine 1-carboxyvinyltransferase, partial [Oscillospiraceae bacterium]|nr:UDP-N-acetylglucosamine 1-carboxyvinyltransferase [Oscillospiraceae bacterium]